MNSILTKIRKYLPLTLLVLPVIAAFVGAFVGMAALGFCLLILSFVIALAPSLLNPIWRG
jgi:hypothetical protein